MWIMVHGKYWRNWTLYISNPLSGSQLSAFIPVPASHPQKDQHVSVIILVNITWHLTYTCNSIRQYRRCTSKVHSVCLFRIIELDSYIEIQVTIRDTLAKCSRTDWLNLAMPWNELKKVYHGTNASIFWNVRIWSLMGTLHVLLHVLPNKSAHW